MDTSRDSRNAAPALTDSRRVWARYVSSRPLPRRLCIADTQTPLDAWILDLSPGGIGLLVNQEVAAGTQLEVELETHPQAAPLTLLANVTHCRPDAEGEFRLGCQFVTPLGEREIMLLQE